MKKKELCLNTIPLLRIYEAKGMEPKAKATPSKSVAF